MCIKFWELENEQTKKINDIINILLRNVYMSEYKISDKEVALRHHSQTHKKKIIIINKTIYPFIKHFIFDFCSAMDRRFMCICVCVLCTIF